MKTVSPNIPENKSNATAIQNGKDQVRSETSAPLPAGIMQAKIYDLVNNSTQVQRMKAIQQMADTSSIKNLNPAQLKSLTNQVIQRVLDLGLPAKARLEDYIKVLDHFTDVFSHSSSIPPFLPKNFFERMTEIEEMVNEAVDTNQVESQFTLDYIDQEMGALKRFMDKAKRDAAPAVNGAEAVAEEQPAAAVAVAIAEAPAGPLELDAAGLVASFKEQLAESDGHHLFTYNCGHEGATESGATREDVVTTMASFNAALVVIRGLSGNGPKRKPISYETSNPSSKDPNVMDIIFRETGKAAGFGVVSMNYHIRIKK